MFESNDLKMHGAGCGHSPFLTTSLSHKDLFVSLKTFSAGTEDSCKFTDLLTCMSIVHYA